MAINILTEPTDPPISGDFTRDQAIQHSNEVPNLSILSLWESTAAAPVAKQGAFIRHAGNTFQVQSADETISGTPSAGLNYIIASESAGVITLAWATSLTGYAYNAAYGGVYNGSGDQVLPDICYLDGTDYIRGMTNGQDANMAILATGRVVTSKTIIPVGEASESSVTVTAGNSYILPAGMYIIGETYDESTPRIRLEVYINGAWESVVHTWNAGLVFQTLYSTIYSDGVNMRLYNYHSSSETVYYRKL